MTYPNTQLFINGHWQDAAEGKTLPVVNPATGKEIGRVAHATRTDLDAALAAAQKGFDTWRNMTAQERGKIMRKAADIFRERVETVATCMTYEQGKPIGEAKLEVLAGADLVLAALALSQVAPAAGRGVRRDFVEAYMWMLLAGAIADNNREALGKRMTPQQIATAERQAKEWKPKPDR